MIGLTEIQKCKECNLDFSKLGMVSHVRHKHNMSFKDYKIKHDLLIKKSNKIKINFSEIKDEIKNQIIEDYRNNISIFDLCEKYQLKEYNIKKFFKESKVELKSNRVAIKEKYEKKLIYLAESDIGKQIIEEYKNPGGLRNLSEKFNLNRNTIKKILIYHKISIKSSKDSRNEVRKRHKQLGIKHPRFGRSTPFGSGRVHWYYYNGMKFQGSWEFKYALYLNSKNIKYKCHIGVKRFEYILDGNILTYCPDFYLEETNEYIEIKGLYSEECKKKMEIIKQTYPNKKFILLTKKELKELNILNIDKILKINIIDFELNKKTEKYIINEIILSIDREEIFKKYVLENFNAFQLSKEFNIHHTFIFRILERLQIPKFESKEYTRIKFEILIKNSGQDIINYYKENKIKDVLEKFKISHKLLTKVMKYFNFKKQQSYPLQKDLLPFKQKIINLYSNSVNIKKIAKEFNTTSKQILLILKENNIHIRTRKESDSLIGNKTKERHKIKRDQRIQLLDIKKIIDFLKDGKGFKEIANYFKVPPLYIITKIKENNIKKEELSPKFVKCPFCNEYFTKLGLPSHFKVKHNLKYSENKI